MKHTETTNNMKLWWISIDKIWKRIYYNGGNWVQTIIEKNNKDKNPVEGVKVAEHTSSTRSGYFFRSGMEFVKIPMEYEYKQFDGLCDRAKELLFDWMLSYRDCGEAIDCICNGDMLNNKFSPIEQIFNICYLRNITTQAPRDKEIDGVPIDVIFHCEFVAQEAIIINQKDKTYIADFVIDFSRKTYDEEYVYPTIKNLKYVIELDGHEYHSDKEQVNHDYEREQDLQMAGYKVIRFTGSQVYNNPYDCVDKLLKIIINDIKGAISGGSNKDK